MAGSPLRRHLEQLHAELADAPTLDSRSRELLQELMRDIQELLERAGDEEPRSDSIAERLKEVARDFEESHPVLVATVGRVADTLANLGI